MTERTSSQAPVESELDISNPTADPIVLAQAVLPADEPVASSLPRDLVEVEEGAAQVAEDLAETQPGPGEPLAAEGEIEIAPLGVGERRVVDVAPGTIIALDAPEFDPSSASYAVDSNDLVVTQANGGVLVLTGFFAPSDAPPYLSVLDGPPTIAGELLARAEAAPDFAQLDEENIEPVTGPVSGGAQFLPYDPGNIGPGLDPLGPLGPTALGFASNFGIADRGTDDSLLGDDGNGGGGNGGSSPVVALRAPFDGTIGEQPDPGFNPVTTPVLPIDAAALQPIETDRTGLTYNEWLQLTPSFRELTDAELNNVDQRNVALDSQREVFVRFINETSYSIDSLFVHEIAADGSIVNVRVVFDGTNLPNDAFNDLKALEPGTEVSLGTYDAGTRLAFITLNDGFRENDFADLHGGRFEVRDAITGEIAKITDFHDTSNPEANPVIVHIADDGTETVLVGQRFFTADASQDSPDNRLNPTGDAAFVSGWDAGAGMLVVGFEDGVGRFDDNTFTDLIFGIRFGSPTENVLVTEDGRGLGATITDNDSTEMSAASITLDGFAGDQLVLDAAVLADTGISFTQVSDTQIDLTGLSLTENYEKVISAIGIDVDVDNPIYGTREVTVTVTDSDGNEGTKSTSFDVQDNLIAGTTGNDTLVGTPSDDVIAGRAGDDQISGEGGNDFIFGGDGRDNIDVSLPGENIVIGGLQADTIILGPGADVVRMVGLSDGTDTIRNFNATEGDKLDLTVLLRDSGITDATFDAFVRTQVVAGDVTVQVDLDGPGTNTSFVDVAGLPSPTGVTPATDPASFVITPADDPAVV
jgi:hypothetical protein